jgi:uncharacterized NAD(P)/FAD-binding protein YdhS
MGMLGDGGSVSPRRVLLLAMPPLLHDIFDQLLRDVPGVTLVAADTSAPSLADAAMRADADVVIAGEQATEPDQVCALLQRHPHARMLSVTHDGRSGVLVELRPHRHVIGDLSPEAVLAAVDAGRSCAERPPINPSPRQVP